VLNRQRRKKGSGKSGANPEEDAQDAARHEVAIPMAPQAGLWLYLTVPLAAILLCGSKEPWALGILAILVGLAALFATPRNRVTPWLTIPVLLGLGLCLLAFLPASWFPMPEWHQTLQRDFRIGLASTRSPQPGITFESWLALAVGAVWLISCASRGFASSERRLAIRVLVAFTSLIAVVALYVHWRGLVIPFWRIPVDVEFLGPFPNRNLFSTLLAAGAVLVFAATYDAFRRQQSMWLPLALAIVPIFAAVLRNTSRAGVVIFFAGLGAWMFTATFQKRSAHRVAVAASILLVLAAAFLLFGGKIIQRISEHDLATDGRLRMFADTLRVIAQAPFLGIGLGNFEPIFAITRVTGDLYSRAGHPENDWIWFGAEAGLPVLLLALVIVGAVISRCGPWRTHDVSGRRDRRLRNAAGIGAILLGASGMVHPVLHAPGLFTLACLLAGLAMRPWSSADPALPPRSILLRKGAGVLCILVGAAWLSTAAGYPVIRGNSFYRQLYGEAVALSANGDDASALEKWNEAAALKPLQWNVYFERARVKLRLGRTSQEALEDFGRARRLEPHNAERLCLREFAIWQDFDPVCGIPALREALKRDPVKAPDFFRGTAGKVREHPELHSHFASIAASDPRFLLIYLPHASGPEFSRLLDGLLFAHPTLDIYSPEQKLQLFLLWQEQGDAARLMQLLQDDADWRQVGWPLLANQKARDGDFRAAYEIARSQVHTPPQDVTSFRKADLLDLARAFRLNPSDTRRGFELFEAQRDQGNYDAALETLDQISKIPHAPPRVLYERGLTLEAKGDFPRAWEALRDYHQRIARGKA
jgi:Flp pilus assembly protein TadD/O-antigen ligase